MPITVKIKPRSEEVVRLSRNGKTHSKLWAPKGLARRFGKEKGAARSITDLDEAPLSEEERLLRAYEEKKGQKAGEKSRGKRIMKEKFAFTAEQKAKVRAEATATLKAYLGRYKFITVVDEKLLNDTLKALLAVADYRSIDPEKEVPDMINSTVDKVFTFKVPELVVNLFEFILSQNVPISQESVYQMKAVLITWGPTLEFRQQLSVLSLIPRHHYDLYKEIFHSYEDLFIEFFSKGYETKSPTEKFYSIEMLRVFKIVNYERLGFVHNIEDLVFENISNLPTYTLTKLIAYVAQTEDMPTDRREKFLKTIDNEVILRARYFNEAEAVDVLFQIVKTSIGSHLSKRLLLSKASEAIRLLTKERKLALIAILQAIPENYKEKLATLTLLQDHVPVDDSRSWILSRR